MKSTKPYEPFCLQVERNFKLRNSEEKPKDSKPRRLTRPISPNFQMAARKKLREGSHESYSESS